MHAAYEFDGTHWAAMEEEAMSELNERVPRTMLEYLLRARDQTYVEAAREFTAVAQRSGERDATMTARHLRRLASGERGSAGPATRRVLREMFGRPTEELFGSFQPDARQPGVQAEGEASSSTDQEEQVLLVAVERARRFGLQAGRIGVNAETIDQMYDDVRTVATAYQQRPLPNILGNLVDTQELVFSLLEQPSRPAEARTLYFLAGTVSGLLAKVSHDHGSAHAAMTHARTAYICAESADHHGLRAWIRGLESMVSYWAGRPQEAIRYAQAGAEAAAAARNSSAVWLHANEARGWAAVGNVPATMNAIRRAEEGADAIEADDLDGLGGICTFTRPRQLYYAADALSWLPSAAESVEQYANQAIDAYADDTASDWSFSDLAGSRVDLAIARVARRELDGAGAAVAPVLELPAEQRINGIVTSTQRLRQAVVSAGLVRDGHELTEQIEVFTRRPLAALGPALGYQS